MPLQGLVLSTVTYNDDGRLRPLFYRLSLAEMGEYSAARWYVRADHCQSFPMRLPRYVNGTSPKL